MNEEEGFNVIASYSERTPKYKGHTRSARPSLKLQMRWQGELLMRIMTSCIAAT
jgi:hypothetical protein